MRGSFLPHVKGPFPGDGFILREPRGRIGILMIMDPAHLIANSLESPSYQLLAKSLLLSLLLHGEGVAALNRT